MGCLCFVKVNANAGVGQTILAYQNMLSIMFQVDECKDVTGARVAPDNQNIEIFGSQIYVCVISSAIIIWHALNFQLFCLDVNM